MGKRRGNEHTAQRRMERKKQKEKKREQAEQNPHPGRKLVKIVTEHFESEAPACMCACKAKKTQARNHAVAIPLSPSVLIVQLLL